MKRSKRLWSAFSVVGVGMVLAFLFVPSVRADALRAAGRLLIQSDPVAPSDIGVMTESGEAGEIELSDLYRAHMISRVVVLVPSLTEVDREFARRGVYRDDIVLTTLRQLGIPETAMLTVDAGEGGTTESTQALGDWVRIHPARAIVVITPSHSRRYRRTLLRVWPENVPPPRITSPRHTLFHATDWWTTRRTRREGLVELEKLAWDYLQHPW